MKHSISLLTTLLLSMNASAALLTTQSSSEKMEQITLSSSATTAIEGDTIKLTEIGAGLRAKKVVFVNIKVYVGELYASHADKLKKTDVMASLKDQKAVAMQMHFLRNVDAENVQKSFKEALKSNDVSLEDSSVKQFLDAVAKGGEAQEGKAITILGTKLKDGSEQITYETTAGTTTDIKGAAGLIDKIFAIWLGKPADDGIAQLKKSLLKN